MGWRIRAAWNQVGGYGEYPPYVSVGERRKKAAKEVAALRKKGKTVSPVTIAGRAIAETFWGKAWCRNLESYSDYETRLPRGRSYVRSGAVVDLQISPGKVSALVCGSELYSVKIGVEPVEPQLWKRILKECSGGIGSLIELLRGELSDAVMDVIARPQTGLFPSPRQIRIQCSCPDWATLCKHAAAVLYGVGARLDREPELLFRLRGVHPEELVSSAVSGPLAGKRRPANGKVLGGDLAGVFGIELEAGTAAGGRERGRRKQEAREECGRGARAVKDAKASVSRRDVGAEGELTSLGSRRHKPGDGAPRARGNRGPGRARA